MHEHILVYGHKVQHAEVTEVTFTFAKLVSTNLQSLGVTGRWRKRDSCQG